MKLLTKTCLAFLSSLTIAFTVFAADKDREEIKVERHAPPVKVNSVTKEIIGHGRPSTKVTILATFGNECEVPRNEELVLITQYSKGYKNLLLTVGVESDRPCPTVYRPVTTMINLGEFTKPNDGLFSKVVVNGKTAK